MAERHDMIDDLIDIRDNWSSVSHPLGSIGDVLDPNQERFDPSSYKERPRVNSIFCLQCTAHSLVSEERSYDACHRCQDICPVDAIDIQKATVRVGDTCRKCGLCVMTCPTESFIVQRVMANQLFERIVRAAGSHEQCYVTCTRALGRLGRMPRDNEVVLPCVGDVPRELWFSVLADHDNVNVYLPLGICDRCRNTTGEEAYTTEIATAEEWSQASVGLEVDASALNHEQTRAYKRAQLMADIARAGRTTVSAASPALSGAQAIAKRIRNHADQLYRMQRHLEQAVGDKTFASRRRILTQKRKAVLGMVQNHPALAGRMRLEVPACDATRCTMCGDCARECPTNACDLDAHGHFSVQAAYCVNCGACVVVCPEDALALHPCDPSELVVRDEDAERRRREAKRRRAALQKAARTGKRQARRVLDSLEGRAS